MKFVITSFFQNQLNTLLKKYTSIHEDFLCFQKEYKVHSCTLLGENIFKCRWKNSSIPTGKRGGLRIIIKIVDNQVYPLLIYAKSSKINVNKEDIKDALRKTIREL